MRQRARHHLYFHPLPHIGDNTFHGLPQPLGPLFFQGQIFGAIRFETLPWFIRLIGSSVAMQDVMPGGGEGWIEGGGDGDDGHVLGGVDFIPRVDDGVVAFQVGW